MVTTSEIWPVLAEMFPELPEHCYSLTLHADNDSIVSIDVSFHVKDLVNPNECN